MNFEWNAIKCFLAVAKHGSFSDASRSLDLSIATLGRRVNALESALGLKLFRRNTRGAHLTEEGAQLLRLAEQTSHQMARIAIAADNLKSSSDRAPIRIFSTEPMISDVLSPRVARLLNPNPELRLEFEVSTEISDLNAGESDIAIRLANPKQETLVARRLPTINLALYCSRNYLDGRDPNSLDLMRERLLWLDAKYGDIPENVWAIKHQLQEAIFLRSSSVRALLMAVQHDAGIAPLPSHYTFSADLVKVASPKLPKRTPWIVFHRDTRSVKRMKIVRDWIHQCCAETFDQ